MIEEGPESFVGRWRRFAADAVLFARPEGSPLLEASVAGAVLQLLERTNPYAAGPGPARVLVQATADDLGPCEDDARLLEVPERGRLRGQGPILEREGRLLVVDVGQPLLLAAEGADGDPFGVGDRIRFEARAPIHGFVLPREARPPGGASIDEAP